MVRFLPHSLSAELNLFLINYSIWRVQKARGKVHPSHSKLSKINMSEAVCPEAAAFSVSKIFQILVYLCYSVSTSYHHDTTMGDINYFWHINQMNSYIDVWFIEDIFVL